MGKKALVLAPLGLLLFFAGLGPFRDYLLPFSFGLGILLIFYLFAKDKRLFLPDGFVVYIIFFLLSLVSQAWSRAPSDGKEYLLLFATGGLFWLSFFNLKAEKGFGELFGWVLVGLGISFASLYLFSVFSEQRLPWTASLAAAYTGNHHHLGDFWVLPLLFLLEKLSQKRNVWYIPLIVFGIFVLALSLSRSAYIALFVGAAVLFANKISQKSRKMLVATGALLAIIFLLASLFKTTLYSRIYFLQGLAGFLKYPLGVGLGNFAIVSKESSFALNGANFFSTLAHNIFLEVLVGMGILGLFFIFWFVKVSKNLLRSPKRNNFLIAGFLALSTNFFFDTTYVIPTMFWLWFILLGLAQKKV